MTAVLYGAPGTFETQKPRAVPVSTPAEVTLGVVAARVRSAPV